MDVDINQFYDTLAEEFAGTLWRSSFEKTNFAQYLFWCPFTGVKHPNGRMPKLSVNFQKDVFHCWVCHYKGVASELLNEKKLLDNIGRKELYEKNKIAHIAEPVEKFIPRTFQVPSYIPITRENYLTEMKRAYRYISKRIGCTIDFIEDFELGVSNEAWIKAKDGKEYVKNSISIFIPSYDKNLRLNYYFQREFLFKQSQKFNANSEKSKVIAFESRIDWNKRDLVLVEGGFDSLRLWSLGIQNVPLLGNSISPDFILYQYIKMYNMEPIILLDQDAEESAQRIKDTFRKDKIRSSVWHTIYDDVEKQYPENLRGNLDPAELKDDHLLRLKEQFDV